MSDCGQFQDYVATLAEMLDKVSDYAWDQESELGGMIDEEIEKIESEHGPDADNSDEDNGDDEYGEGAGVYQEDCEVAQDQFDQAEEAIASANQGILAYETSKGVMNDYIGQWRENILAAERQIDALRDQFAMTEDASIGGQIDALQGLIQSQESNITEFEMWIGLVDEAIARLENNVQLAEFFRSSALEMLNICASGNLPPEPETEPLFEEPPLAGTNWESDEENMADLMATYLLRKYDEALGELDDCVHAVEENKAVPEADPSQWVQFNENGYPVIFPYNPDQLEEVFGGESSEYPEDDYEEPEEEEEEFLDFDADEMEDVYDEIDSDLEFLDEVEEAIDSVEEEQE